LKDTREMKTAPIFQLNYLQYRSGHIPFSQRIFIKHSTAEVILRKVVDGVAVLDRRYLTSSDWATLFRHVSIFPILEKYLVAFLLLVARGK
jgi:hypothetical protein